MVGTGKSDGQARRRGPAGRHYADLPRGERLAGSRPFESVMPGPVRAGRLLGWRLLLLIGWVAIVAGIGLFGWECLLWLRDGFWTRSTLSDLWGQLPLGGGGRIEPWQEMQGLHLLLYRSLRSLGHVPTSLALVAVGLACAWSANGALISAEERRVRRLR